MEFGLYIKKIRLAAERTQGSVAKDAGVSTAMISMIETGSRKTTIEMAKSILDGLGLSYSQPDTNLISVEKELFFFESKEDMKKDRLIRKVRELENRVVLLEALVASLVKE